VFDSCFHSTKIQITIEKYKVPALIASKQKKIIEINESLSRMAKIYECRRTRLFEDRSRLLEKIRILQYKNR